jgi:outer membrane protein OmpA-like peptidoglycan-associated protein
VIETREEKSEIIMRREAGLRLGLKEGSKIYLVNYGKRLFLFEDRVGAERFVEKIKKAGAQIRQENIKEMEGVYIKGEIGIKKEDIKEIGDLSKGIIVEEYRENIKEMKSAAEEEKRKKREEINKTKLEAAQERREKPIIKSYRLNIANFASNEYELTKEAKEVIREQAREIRQYEYKKITVEGHADATGRDEINDKISRERAMAVYKEFMLNGIPSEKISYIGFGARMPIDSNKTKSGRATNRRTEIFVE